MSERLTPLAELPPEAGENLLLGNGFSLAFSQNFAYPSLLARAIELKLIPEPLGGVFGDFQAGGSFDFENALARLWTSRQVAEVLGQDPEPYGQAYSQVREALLQSVRAAHPIPSDIDSDLLKAVGERLASCYKKVFTTNYDLLLYWCMARGGFLRFADFFWNECAFDPACMERSDRVPVFFLHGALHLYSRDGVVRKLAGNEVATILDRVDEQWQKGDIPHFVSEGEAKQKIASINRSPYLSWTAHRFSTIDRGLTVFGSSMGAPDKHLADWISRNHRLTHIAVSVHSSEEDQEKAILEYRLKLADFTGRGGELHFCSSGEIASMLGLVGS